MTETPETEITVAPKSPGAILKQAREGKDLSIAAIATQLNLDLRTVEALELGDQSKLPAPIFVRGYLRGYARLVDVREEEVLAAYQALAPQEPSPRAVTLPRKTLRPAYLMPAIPWRSLLGLLVLIGLGLLAFEIGPQLMNRLTQGDASDATPTTRLILPASGDNAPPAVEQSVAAPEATAGLSLALPEPAPSGIEDLQPPAIQEPEPNTTSDTDFGASPVADAVAPAAPAQLSLGQTRLDFSFIADSWVEVRDADSSKLLFGLVRKGDNRSVTGKAPISILLGNASAVTLTVDGEAFDAARYTRGNVARFTVPPKP